MNPETEERLYKEIRSEIFRLTDSPVPVSDSDIDEAIDRAIDEAGYGTRLKLGDRLRLKNRLFNSMKKLDVLQELLDDPRITEIMINSHNEIFVERNNRIIRWEQSVESNEKLEDIIQLIVGRINRKINTASPIADARLEDGSRVNIILPPIALKGPTVTIRKFPETISMNKMLTLGTLSREAAEFLKMLVVSGYNIFISGGTGSGKSTFLNALSEFIPEDERVITIEDAAELNIRNVKNVVSLETRDANADGNGEINMSMLIKASLRMRPDRIIVGEVRGKEALDMLNAMNTGHDGSLSTGHANSTADMLTRLETMVLMAADMPIEAIKSQIAAGLDILVHLQRMPDKSRRVVEISELIGLSEGEIRLNELYRFDYTEKRLKKTGELKNTHKLRARGLI